MCCIISPISAHDGAALSPLFLSGMSREMSAQEGEREKRSTMEECYDNDQW